MTARAAGFLPPAPVGVHALPKPQNRTVSLPVRHTLRRLLSALWPLIFSRSVQLR